MKLVLLAGVMSTCLGGVFVGIRWRCVAGIEIKSYVQLKDDYNIHLKVLGHQVATGPQLRAGERERPARLPPRYDERRHLAHTSINCVRGDYDYDDD